MGDRAEDVRGMGVWIWIGCLVVKLRRRLSLPPGTGLRVVLLDTSVDQIVLCMSVSNSGLQTLVIVFS